MVYVAAFLPQDGAEPDRPDAAARGRGGPGAGQPRRVGRPAGRDDAGRGLRARRPTRTCSDEMAAWAIAQPHAAAGLPVHRAGGARRLRLRGHPARVRALRAGPRDPAAAPAPHARGGRLRPRWSSWTPTTSPQLSRTAELAAGAWAGSPRRVRGHASRAAACRRGRAPRGAACAACACTSRWPGRRARPAGGAPARLAAALVRVAPPDRAARRRPGYRVDRARLPRLRLVGVPARRGLPQGDPGRRPDRAVRRARARADRAASATTGAAGSAGCCACAGRTWSSAPCCSRRRRRSRPTGSSRPRSGAWAGWPTSCPIAAPMPAAPRSSPASGSWATCWAGRPPDEVEVYAETADASRAQVRASTLLYRQFLTARGGTAARAPLRRPAPDRAGALPGRRRGPPVLRRAWSTSRRRTPTRNTAGEVLRGDRALRARTRSADAAARAGSGPSWRAQGPQGTVAAPR